MLFGKPSIRPTKLARIIATEVIPLAARIERKKLGAEDSPKKRAIRTQAVKIVLRREAKKLGYTLFLTKEFNKSILNL